MVSYSAQREIGFAKVSLWDMIESMAYSHINSLG